MANETETFNARISSASLYLEDHGFWTSFVHLEMGGSGQGFGGYALKGEAMHIWVEGVCEALDVTNWSKLSGMIVRAKRENGLLVAIGHPIEDKWFTPSEAFAHLTEKKAS